MPTPSELRGVRAVVLAGGRGRRLEPFTTILPKPLAPIGQQPVLDIILRQLERDGFDDVVVSLGHLGELIQAYLATRIDAPHTPSLVREHEPLGTAGALSLVDEDGCDLLVVNGDVLTDASFADVVATHRASGAALTVTTQVRRTRSSFGELEVDDGRVLSFTEKPERAVECSIGINVYGAAAIAIARERAPIDFPDVVNALIEAGEGVAVHRHDGYWCDIGTREDYERAQREFGAIEDVLAPGRPGRVGPPAPG